MNEFVHITIIDALKYVMNFIVYIEYRVVVLIAFFFQAEDGIRDKLVTGVQTCALPILHKLYEDRDHLDLISIYLYLSLMKQALEAQGIFQDRKSVV
mgnify:CR=1 FL=1